jgi:hypothetical protein
LPAPAELASVERCLTARNRRAHNLPRPARVPPRNAGGGRVTVGDAGGALAFNHRPTGTSPDGGAGY